MINSVCHPVIFKYTSLIDRSSQGCRYVCHLFIIPSFLHYFLTRSSSHILLLYSFLPPLRIFSSYSIPSFLPLFFLTYTSLPFLLIPFLSFVLLLFYFLTFLSLSSLLSILYDFKRQALTLDILSLSSIPFSHHSSSPSSSSSSL